MAIPLLKLKKQKPQLRLKKSSQSLRKTVLAAARTTAKTYAPWATPLLGYSPEERAGYEDIREQIGLKGGALKQGLFQFAKEPAIYDDDIPIGKFPGVTDIKGIGRGLGKAIRAVGDFAGGKREPIRAKQLYEDTEFKPSPFRVPLPIPGLGTALSKKFNLTKEQTKNLVTGYTEFFADPLFLVPLATRTVRKLSNIRWGDIATKLKHGKVYQMPSLDKILTSEEWGTMGTIAQKKAYIAKYGVKQFKNMVGFIGQYQNLKRGVVTAPESFYSGFGVIVPPEVLKKLTTRFNLAAPVIEKIAQGVQVTGVAVNTVKGIQSALKTAGVQVGTPVRGEPSARTEVIGEKRVPRGLRLKRRVEQVAGVVPEQTVVNTTEQVLLKARLRAEARGALTGYKTGAKDVRKDIYTALKVKNADIGAIKREIIDYAKQRLSIQNRGGLLSLVAEAKTQKGLTKAFNRINTIEAHIDRRAAVAELRNTIGGLNLKKVRPEFKADLEALADIDLAAISSDKLKSLLSRKRYIESNPFNNVPQDKIDEIGRIAQKSIKDMTVEEIETVNNVIKMTERLMATKNKLIFGRRLEEFKDVLDKAVKNVGRKGRTDKTPDIFSTTDKPPQAGNVRQFFGIDSSNPEMIAQELDKEKYGIIKKIIYDDFDKGVDRSLRFEKQMEKTIKIQISQTFPNGKVPDNWSETFIPQGHLRMLFDKIGFKAVGAPDYVMVKLPSSGKTIKMTKGERISFYLDSLNDKNLKHLLEGETSFENNITKGVRLTGDDVTAILDGMSDKELKVAHMMSDWLNGPQREALNETSVTLDGAEVAAEENYWRIRTNALDRKRDVLKSKQNFTQRTLEGSGWLKPRSNSGDGIIIGDAFQRFYKSVKDAATYIGLAEPLRNMKMLVGNPVFEKTVTQNYGTHYVKSLKKYIADMELMTTDRTSVDKLALGWINRLDIAFLGLNPFVIGLQPWSYLAAFASELKLSPKMFAQIKPASIEEMSTWCPQLWDRFKGKVNREAGEIAEMGAPRRLFTGKRLMGQQMMRGLMRGDYESIGRIWNATKIETRQLYPQLQEGTNEFMEHVADRAWEVIRKTQPTFHPKDRCEILRNSHIWHKLLTKYTTQLNKYNIMLKRSMEEYLTSERSVRDKGRLVKTMVVLGVLAGGKYFRDEARDKLLGKPPKKAPKRGFILRMIGNFFGTMFGLNRVLPSIISKIERGPFGGYGPDDMITSTMEQVIDGIVHAFIAIDQYVKEEEYKVSSKKYGFKKGDLKWRKSAERSITGLSKVLAFEGVPVGTLKALQQLGITQYNNIKKLVFGDTTEQKQTGTLRFKDSKPLRLKKSTSLRFKKSTPTKKRKPLRLKY